MRKIAVGFLVSIFVLLHPTGQSSAAPPDPGGAMRQVAQSASLTEAEYGLIQGAISGYFWEVAAGTAYWETNGAQGHEPSLGKLVEAPIKGALCGALQGALASSLSATSSGVKLTPRAARDLATVVREIAVDEIVGKPFDPVCDLIYNVIVKQMTYRDACIRDFVGLESYSKAEIDSWIEGCVENGVLAYAQEILAELEALRGQVGAPVSPLLPLGLSVDDGTHYNAAVGSQGQIQLTYQFLPQVAGTLRIEVGVVNGGREFILRTESATTLPSEVGKPAEGTLSLSSVSLLALDPGDDRAFRFFVRFVQDDGTVLRYDGPISPSVHLYVESPQTNAPPVAFIKAEPAGNVVRFAGSYSDPDGNPAASLVLQIDGAQGRQELNLLAFLAAGDPRQERRFSRSLMMANGSYQYRLLVSDGAHARVLGDFPLRVSSTAPQVTLDLSTASARVGERVDGTVSVS